MKTKIVIELDSSVIDRIASWTSFYGLEFEEGIKYLMSTLNLSLPMESPASRYKDITLVLARLLSVQGGTKCPNCTQLLRAEDIVVGRCSRCESGF